MAERDRGERLALLGHELAHLVNNDPARMGLPAAAFDVLNGWQFLLEPHYYHDIYTDTVEREYQGFVAEILIGAMRGIVDLTQMALERLAFMPQQRSEYLADALSAGIAGKRAAVSLLRRTILSSALPKEWNKMVPRRDETGTSLITRLSAVLDQLEAAEVEAILANHYAEKLTVNASHPPSQYRIAFVTGLGAENDLPSVRVGDWGEVNRELAPYLEKLGEKLIDGWTIQ
jgi:heat shock protein HtpX